MSKNERVRKDPAVWGNVHIEPGEGREVNITLSKSYSGVNTRIPIFVWRGKEDGPSMFVSAAVHGDEINGTGAIRQIIMENSFMIERGTLILAPVVNILGFERHSRYLPDRRDLNRCFPGTREGSLSSRMARVIFDEIVMRSDYGIDLHTAALRRTNFPNVRADMKNEKLNAFAKAFGAELLVQGTGPKGSLRRSATKAGCPTLILEAGEVWKVEPSYMAYTIRGVSNCLKHVGMMSGEIEKPKYQIVTDASKWVRAQQGGFLKFHVGPGDMVEKGDPIATNTNLTGCKQNLILAPRSGVILGMTTLPSVSPGDPVCHLAFMKKGELRKAELIRDHMEADTLHEMTREDLARNMVVAEKQPKDEDSEENGLPA